MNSPDSIASKTSTTSKLEKSTPQTPRTTEGEPQDKMSWGEFHAMVGLEPSQSKKSSANGRIATDRAQEMGMMGWKFDSSSKNFVRK